MPSGDLLALGVPDLLGEYATDFDQYIRHEESIGIISRRSMHDLDICKLCCLVLHEYRSQDIAQESREMREIRFDVRKDLEEI